MWLKKMKTTLELPHVLFRRAKSVAAQRGIALRELVSEALEEKLMGESSAEKPLMASFGKLKTLRAESARIGRIIEQDFERIGSEALR
jgi:hypothetical protein